jgi:DNA-binding CsgD family transcriptional regulator
MLRVSPQPNVCSCLQKAPLAAAPLAIERRERVQTAQRLQGQLSTGEIADLLGVGARTVRA